MPERLSDERLHELCGIPQAMPWREVPQMAQELLALRAQLAAGPVMPAAPSDNVRRAIAWLDVPVRLLDGAYTDIRAALEE